MTVTSRHPEAETDHGRGFILCLIKFAQHAEHWLKIQEEYESMRNAVKDNDKLLTSHLFDKTGEVSRFFYGASDHLFNLEIPDKWAKTKIGRKTRKLRDMCLDMRLGLSAMRHNREYTGDEIQVAYDLLEEIALLIDKELGLKPDIGQY